MYDLVSKEREKRNLEKQEMFYLFNLFVVFEL